MKWHIPETIGTSAMDCGPAALASLLAGHRLAAPYDRLRTDCRTDVDGTSIDRLEEVACARGLDAEQVMLPADVVALPEAEALPAIVVTRLPDGQTHFIVIWRRLGGFVQVMDPAAGRRWTTVDAVVRSLYVHPLTMPAAAWRGWAASPAHHRITRARLARLGVRGAAADRLVARAEGDAGFLTWAALDAAIRMVAPMVDAGGVGRGHRAAAAIDALIDRLGFDGDALTLPPGCWSVLPAPAPDGAEEPWVQVSGAVLVRVRGRRAVDDTAGDPSGPVPRATPSKAASPLRTLARLLLTDGWLAPALIMLALLATTVVAVVEAALMRGLIDIVDWVGAPEQRLGALAALVVFMIAALALEAPTQVALLRLGRGLEVRLRSAFRHTLPRLGARYLHSRPISDLAERAHGIDGVRSLPGLAARVALAAGGLVCTAGGLIWLDPGLAIPVLLTVAGGLAAPLLTVPLLAERDLRHRTHAGALTRYGLDALLGLSAIRTHGGQRAIRRRHEQLLTEWADASLSLERLALIIEGALAVAGALVVGWLLHDHLGRAADTRGVLLLVWWGLALPGRARGLVDALHAWPAARNQALRILEPLDAPRDETGDAPDDRPAEAPGLALRLRAVDYTVGEVEILRAVDLDITPGDHVAIVGRSGAGKSSLARLLLGLAHPTGGAIEVDGAPLAGPALARLRRDTAWVDPSVQIWNHSLLDNLRYGHTAPIDPGAVIDGAELRGVLGRLADGLQTPLGEGGGLLSGGEGQRVRLGRALAHDAARLVLLDEPFRGLDRAARRRLLDRARGRWLGATLVCISHDIAETRAFDRVVVIDDGRIVEQGAPAALAAADGPYAALLAADARAARAWRDPRWQHRWLADGRLEATPSDAIMPSDAICHDGIEAIHATEAAR